ncbi:MAG: hypothetical protein NT018_03935 [Armatimonadetes bacterium]|nr:hypothetical protein [Armatimonadota bacterium]
MMKMCASARRAAMLIVGLLIMGCEVLAATVGPQIAINPTFGSAIGSQEYISLAASPTGYFAVWQDTRGTNGADIYGCRISLTGQIMDLAGIPICTYASDQVTPAVAWDGQKYMVVWGDRRGPLQHIYACRVTTAGEVLEPQGILVSGATGGQTYPRLAGDGAGALVVWQDSRGASPDIYGCKVGADGSVGKAYGIATRADNEEMPDVAYNGSTHLVVWRDYRNMVSTDTDIYGVRVSKSGVRTGSDILISNATDGVTGAARKQHIPRICAFGSSWAVTWEDFRNDSLHPDIYAARVSSTGSVQDKGGIALCKVTGDQESPSIGYNGSKILVCWRNGSDRRIKGARLTTNGGILDTNGIYISAGAANATGNAVSGANNSFVVCWSTLNATSADAMLSPVTDAGVAQNTNGTLISSAIDSQQDYAVIDNGTEYAVVWSQIVNSSQDIMGARVSKSGQVLTASPINLTSGISGNQTQPAIAWNGSKYLLTWRGSEAYITTDLDIRGRFLDANMMPIGTTPIVISAASEEQSRPTVASNKTNFLVVWQDSRNALSPNYYNDLYGAMVSSTGTVTQITTAISMAVGNQNLPKAATDGANYMVVWEDYRGATPVIRGTRITSAGSVQDASGIAFPTTTSSQNAPNLCYGNGSYFVIWSESTKISACRLSTAGVLIDSMGIAINTISKTRQSPSACWDGQKYQLVWEDYGSSAATNGDIYITTVSSAGVVTSYPETALVSDVAPQLRPFLFMSGGFGALFFVDYVNYSNSVMCTTLEDRGIQEVASIAAAKELAAGSLIVLSDKVVSAVFPGYFYMQELNRASGIKVVSSAGTAVGNLEDVIGTVSIVDGERQINAGEAIAMGTAGYALKPLGIRGDWLGGGALNAQTPGITGARGVNNIGLLVKTWGKVISQGSGYFYIESKPTIAIRVKSGSLTQPAIGAIVTVTGISTCELVSGALYRAILPRVQGDIKVLK